MSNNFTGWVNNSCPRRRWSPPSARHLVSPHHSNCYVSLKFLVQAPRHLSPMLVSYSTSFTRLGWVLLVIQICAVQEYLPLLALCWVFSSFSAFIGEGRAPPEMLLGAPLTVLTTAAGAATAGAAPHPPAISGAGLLEAFLSKNVMSSFCLHRLPQLLP